MIDYAHAWKVRKIQIIVVNIILLLIGIGVAVSDKQPVEGLAIWFFGSWIVGTLISSFSKSGDKISSLALNVVSVMFNGAFAAVTGGPLFIFFFMFAVVKCVIGVIVLGVVLAFEFVAFPITTIYYYIKSREDVQFQRTE